MIIAFRPTGACIDGGTRAENSGSASACVCFAARIDYKQLDAVLGSLQKLKPTLRFKDSSKALAEQAGIPDHDALQLLTVLASLFALRDRPGIPDSDLPDKLIDAIKEDDEIEFPEGREDSLRDFRRRVLKLGANLGITAKAWTVAQEFSEHTVTLEQ